MGGQDSTKAVENVLLTRHVADLLAVDGAVGDKRVAVLCRHLGTCCVDGCWWRQRLCQMLIFLSILALPLCRGDPHHRLAEASTHWCHELPGGSFICLVFEIIRLQTKSMADVRQAPLDHQGLSLLPLLQTDL